MFPCFHVIFLGSADKLYNKLEVHSNIVVVHDENQFRVDFNNEDKIHIVNCAILKYI